jgi:hypothetical protein
MWKQSKQGEIPRAEDKKKPVQPAKTNHFDPETGQIYTEAQARIGSRYHSDWIGEFKAPSLIRNSQPNSHGARTLLDMAKTSTVKQLRSLSQEHLAVIPWCVARDIWTEVVAR